MKPPGIFPGGFIFTITNHLWTSYIVSAEMPATAFFLILAILIDIGGGLSVLFWYYCRLGAFMLFVYIYKNIFLVYLYILYISIIVFFLSPVGGRGFVSPVGYVHIASKSISSLYRNHFPYFVPGSLVMNSFFTESYQIMTSIWGIGPGRV